MKPSIAALALTLAAAPAVAQADGFATGPVFDRFGPVAPVETATPIPPDARFAVAFDVAQGAEPGAVNRGFESAARLINMLARAGIPPEQVRVAVVVHGAATLDLLSPAAYSARRDGAENGNAALIEALAARGVAFQLCGQSAAANKVVRTDLLPQVEMALSAMTAHALLQQQGYTINPF